MTPMNRSNPCRFSTPPKDRRSDAFGAAAAKTLPAASLTGRTAMAGVFEVFVDAESQFRFRLKAPDGSVLAISAPFEDKRAAAAGIADVRECAGTGLITDLSPAAAPVTESTPVQAAVSAPAPVPAQVLPARPGHRRQGFGKNRTLADAPGSPLCRPVAPAEPVPVDRGGLAAAILRH
jgi:uncharacterized protein YegP (UPF0339 family)